MHVLATFTHHDPGPGPNPDEDPNFDPLAGGGEPSADAVDAAALGALDAALADESLPEPAPPADATEGKKPDAAAEPDPLQPDLLDQALAGDTPAAAVDPAAAKAKADEEAAAAAATKTDAEKAEDARKAKVDADVEALRAELKAEGKELSPKGEARFRAAAETISQQQVHLDTVAKTFGIDFAKPEEAAQRIEAIKGNAQAGIEMVNLVLQTGAQPEQYTMALDYLAVANKANAGDKKAQEQAWTWLLEELSHYGQLLGRDVPGLVDPLKDHPDLQADVENELMPRARALEIAAGRADAKRQEDERKLAQLREQQANQKATATDEAIAAGQAALNALGPKLAAKDPGGEAAFKAKGPQLIALVRKVAAEYPPDQWETQVALGYLELKVPETATPAKPAAPAGAPMRAAGPVGVLQGEYATPEEALEAGIMAADQGT